MLRLLVLALLLANAAYLAWAKGSLAALGFAPAAQTEPHRLGQQIRPEVLRLQPAAGQQPGPAGGSRLSPAPSAPGASSPASSLTPALLAASTQAPATSCLQAGLYNEEQTAALRSRLQGTLPPGSWLIESSVEPVRWLVYMGRYADMEALDKKKAELRQRQVAFQALGNPALEPGLSLGNFATQPEAEAELARISQQGVRTARVVQGNAEVRGQRVKFPAADAALQAQLNGMKSQLFAKPLLACR
ncbi:MAG: putative signal peptide protein [Polaromonas sp.]|jgi:hypothetical protein|nr:putative signal peptide protein [Polaromonas sp.]